MAVRYVAGINGDLIPVDDRGWRKFSKLKIYSALKAKGVWAQVKAYLEEHDLWEAFLLAQIVDEQDAGFAEGLAALKTALGVGDDEAEEILAACVADGK